MSPEPRIPTPDSQGVSNNKIQQKREAHQWWVANKIVRKSDAVAVEDLQIKNMMKRCKPLASETGRFLPNGQAAKRGLNRSIADASWYALTQKLEYVAAKSGKKLYRVDPRHTSAIERASRGEFLSGFTRLKFGPNQNLTKSEAIVCLVNGLELKGGNPDSLKVYSDQSLIPNFAVSAIATATDLNIVVKIGRASCRE